MGKRKAPPSYRSAIHTGNQQALERYTQRAKELLRDNQPDAANQVLRQAISLAPRNAMLHYDLGKQLIQQDKNKEGTEQLEKALELDPRLAVAHIELGQLYSNKGQLDKALTYIKAALEHAPENPAAYLVYGAIRQKQGELHDAITYFRTGLELRLNHPTQLRRTKKKEDFDKPLTEKIMWDTLTLLATHGIHAFASYGTLLGIVREGGLLPFDKDIDFGLPHCEMEKASACLKRHGWLQVNLDHITNPRAFLHHTTKITLDLSGFTVEPDTNETFTGFWLDNIPYEWSRTTKYPTIELEKATSPFGRPIWALRNPETWLETIYGKEWRIPDPTFDTVIAAKNLYGFSLLTQCYAFSRVYTNWDSGNLPRALALLGHTQRHLPYDDLMQKIRAHIEAVLPADHYPRPPSVQQTENGTDFEALGDQFDAAFKDEDHTLSFD